MARSRTLCCPAGTLLQPMMDRLLAEAQTAGLQAAAHALVEAATCPKGRDLEPEGGMVNVIIRRLVLF